MKKSWDTFVKSLRRFFANIQFTALDATGLKSNCPFVLGQPGTPFR